MTAPRLKTNLAILVLGDAAGKLINVLVFSRLGRVLDRERYGMLEFALATIFVGALLVEAGLGPWGARAVARGDDAASRILGRIMALRAAILTGVLLVLGASVAVLGNAEDGVRVTLLLAAGLMLVPKAATCEWLFQGRNEMRSVTFTAILDPLVALVGTVLFVTEPAHLIRVPFILAAGTASVAVAQQILARRSGAAPDFRGGIAGALSTIRAALPLGLSTLSWAVRFFSPMLAVGLFVSGAGAGSFGAAHRLTVSVHAIVWLYFFNLLPTWSRESLEQGALERSIGRSLRLTAALGAALVAGIAILAPLLQWGALYGAAYEESVDLLRILGLVPALAWISGNFRFGLIARGLLRAELVASASGAVLAVAAFLVLRSRLDVWTAAAVFCAAEALTLLVAWGMWRANSAPGGAPPTRSP